MGKHQRYNHSEKGQDRMRRFRESWTGRTLKQVENMNRRTRLEYEPWRGLMGRITTEEWRELQRKVGFKCEECGLVTEYLQPHHRIPMNDAGLNIIENIEPLCEECHAWRGCARQYQGHFSWKEPEDA